MLERGYVKLFRTFLNWEWYSDINASRVFLHLLLVANHEPSKWRGIDVNRGQRITSRANLSKETGLSEMEVRTALNKLKRTGELSIQTTNKYTVITINNYNKYQGDNQQNTNHQPTNNQLLSTKEESKKARKDLTPIPPEGADAGESLTVETAQGAADAADHSTTPQEPRYFPEFWKAYPNKVGKGAARKIWAKRKPDRALLEVMLAAIAAQKNSSQWQRDGGQYIPNPATWLNQERWEDEPNGPGQSKPAAQGDLDFLLEGGD